MKSDAPAGTLLVVTGEEEPAGGERGVFSSSAAFVRNVVKVQSEDLSATLAQFCRQISAMVDKVEITGGFKLESLEVYAELTAKGEVRLIGSAASEVKGGLKLTFKR